MNAVEIEEAVSELVAQQFVASEFPYAFLQAFGNKEATLKKLRKGESNKSDVLGGVLQRDNIHLAVCDKGHVSETMTVLRNSPATQRWKAKFILATDGETLEAEQLNSDEAGIVCNFPDLTDEFGFFLPLAGITYTKEISDTKFDRKAVRNLNKLYVELLRHNPDWAKSARRHDMNHFMARLIFCFFAEDTKIFHGSFGFTETVLKMSERDSSNTHEIISELFRAMNVPTKHEGQLDDRYRKAEKIKSWANPFPYVNGELFSGDVEVPRFSKIARSYLANIGNLEWDKINPDIFGSMIQAVADDEERGALGMHYTSVPNILKVLNPLFLDELNTQLEEAGNNTRKLLNLRNRIAKIRAFDPACGSGNFLVIAYKELRKIEAEINQRRGEPDRKSDISLTNFRGIEYRSFPAEIARLALIIAEFQCDVLYRGELLALAEVLPLNAENWIECGNALRLDWLTVCPSTGQKVKTRGDDLFSTPLEQTIIDFENEGGETYICGNPPYLGSTWQSREQKDDLKAIFVDRTKSWKSLDYVAGWFMKAADYGTRTNAASAFVSTNSICQGQQVPILWPLIFKTGHEIHFAHTSFKWTNLASHNAGVTVVIVGLSNHAGKPRHLFSIDENGETLVREAGNINAYLVAAPHLILDKSASPITIATPMDRGNSAIDGGGLLLEADDAHNMIKAFPNSEAFIRNYLGSEELINGKLRYCLWLNNDELDSATAIPAIQSRLSSVVKMRTESSKAQTNAIAHIPHRFGEIRHRESKSTIVVPRVSSENRDYLPVGLVEGGTIIGDRNFALYDAPLWNMALIASRLHWVWIGTVCVRMRTDFSYSNTLGWNTFPVPNLTKNQMEALVHCAEDILLAREAHFPATIADLYDPKKMPENLAATHAKNDETLERIYIGRKFRNDTERLEHLFERYTKMTAAKLKA